MLDGLFCTCITFLITLPLVGVWSIVICVFVCLCICLSAYVLETLNVQILTNFL